MDPLHPLVPIQPAPPVPPDYTRVQRVARDQQRESEPDWQHSPDEESEDQQRDQQFEDDYDPDWSDTAAAEVYNDHGELTDASTSGEHATSEHATSEHATSERRRHPSSTGDPEDQQPGPHIDIIA